MLSITKNSAWIKFEKLFGPSILKRYDWFLFEFGKKMTSLIHKELLGRLEDIKGTDKYKKQLVIAEIRNSGDRTWFAIAARALPLKDQKEESKTQILKVVKRFVIKDERDPIKEILEDYGPWTEESIPFVPSLRQAMVIVKDVSKETYQEILKKNEIDLPIYTKLMSDFRINTQIRRDVKTKLRAVKDLDIQALQLEYRKVSEGKPHWRPAIKYAKTQGLRKLMTDRDLIRSMTESSFIKWKSYKHLRVRMNSNEMKNFEKFQKEIIKGL